MSDRLARFTQLIAQVRAEQERRRSTMELTRADRHRRFEKLVNHARPTLLGRLRNVAKDVCAWRAQHMTASFDLFNALAIDGREASYTACLAWLLTPGTPHAERFSDALLDAVARPWQAPAGRGRLVHVRQEVSTADGRVDLLLEYEQATVVVEAKVWTYEHETPSGTLQTTAYATAIAEALHGGDAAKPVAVVLLSPDARAPASPTAGRLGFFALALALLSVLRTLGDDDSARVIRLYCEHLIETAANAVGGTFRGLPQLDQWTDATLLRKSANLAALERLLFPPEASP